MAEQAAAAAAAPPPAAFDAEERRLIERLRGKYARGDADAALLPRDQHHAASSPPAPSAPVGPVGAAMLQRHAAIGSGSGGDEPHGAPPPPDTAADGVRMCIECGGEGRRREVYHHRVIERTCRGCGGEGCIKPTSAAVAAAAAAAGAATPVPAPVPAAAAAAATGDRAPERAPPARSDEQLAADAARLEALRAERARELEATRALLLHAGLEKGGGASADVAPPSSSSAAAAAAAAAAEAAERRDAAEALARALDDAVARIDRRLARIRLALAAARPDEAAAAAAAAAR